MSTRPGLLVPDDYQERIAPVATPHVGWAVQEVFDEFAAIAADQLENYPGGGLDTAELLIP